MLGLVKIVFLFCGILALGTAAVVGVPDTTRLVHGGWTWTPFRLQGGAFTVPRGWTCHDAWSTSFAHAGLGPYECAPPLDTHLAYFRDATGDAEAFLYFGAATALWPLAEQVSGSVVEVCPQAKQAKTADGTVLDYRVARMPAGGPGGADVTWLLATAKLGDRALVLSAGARTPAFDAAPFLELIASLRLPAR